MPNRSSTSGTGRREWYTMRDPNAATRSATVRPICPIPTIPTVASARSSMPSGITSAGENRPARVERSLAGSRFTRASISITACSAAPIRLTPGL